MNILTPHRSSMRGLAGRVALVAAGMVVSAAACAAGYPDHPIRLIVPYAAGGGTDIVARMLAQRLTESLGQQVIVENHAGAATQSGTALVVRAAPDGYTLLMGTANLATNAPLFAHLAYDAQTNLAPVSLVTKVPVYLFVNATSPVKSPSDLIARSKATPGGMSYATAGTGSIPHLAGEMLRSETHADIVHIPYKGSSEAATALIGGQVAFSLDNLPPLQSQLKAGTVRALAIAMPQRSSLLPAVPTLTELGYPIEAYSWWGVLAPAGTPAAVIERLNREVLAALKPQDVRDRFKELGIEPVGSTPEEFAAHIRAETVKWTRVVKAAGIQPE
jgi:tripartite-type tricarboxylate transporter receptor subunit TctC